MADGAGWNAAEESYTKIERYIYSRTNNRRAEKHKQKTKKKNDNIECSTWDESQMRLISGMQIICYGFSVFLCSSFANSIIILLSYLTEAFEGIERWFSMRFIIMSDGVVMRTQKKNDRKRGQQLQPRIDRRVNRDSQNSWLEFQDDTMNKYLLTLRNTMHCVHEWFIRSFEWKVTLHTDCTIANICLYCLAMGAHQFPFERQVIYIPDTRHQTHTERERE